MKNTTVVSERGQITVPKSVRDRLALVPGTELEVDVTPGGFVARKLSRTSAWRSLAGVLGRPADPDRLVEAMRGKPDAVGR